MLIPLSVYVVNLVRQCNQECLYESLCVYIEKFLIS